MSLENQIISSATPGSLGGVNMTSSLNSYDLGRLFGGSGGPHHHRGGGEALVEDVRSSRDISSESDSDIRVMTDSLSTVSWDDINDDHDDNDGDDESKD